MRIIGYIIAASSILSNATWATAQHRDASPLKLVQTIALPDVEGRIDHMAVDLKGKRLFMAALGNNTLEVIDLVAGKHVTTIRGLKEPQGVAYLPETNSVVVANGHGDGCGIYECSSYKLIANVKLGDDSDNIRYDPTESVVFVGYGSGSIASFVHRYDQLAENGMAVPSKLSGHPESFQIEKKGPRIYVNVPDAGVIEVINRQTMRVVTKWPVTSAQANYPMALDEKNHRLFIGCRKPAKMLVYDTQTGKQVAEIGISGDTDDLFYDTARKRIYVSCGEGFVDIIQQVESNNYRQLGRQATVPGARTSLFVPELNRLYVACRKNGGNPAEIRVYEVAGRSSRARHDDLTAVIIQNHGFHFLLP
jgi:DNA-binding beta-propeller fold protein YncE